MVAKLTPMILLLGAFEYASAEERPYQCVTSVRALEVAMEYYAPGLVRHFIADIGTGVGMCSGQWLGDRANPPHEVGRCVGFNYYVADESIAERLKQAAADGILKTEVKLEDPEASSPAEKDLGTVPICIMVSRFSNGPAKGVGR